MIPSIERSLWSYEREYSSEEKIRIVLEGIRGEQTVAELCRREGINENLYYRGNVPQLATGRFALCRLVPRSKLEKGGGEIVQM